MPHRDEVVFLVKGREERAAGQTRDLGLGGMFVETTSPAPFGAEIVVHLQLGGASYALPGVVRWVRADGIGVQFGMLGAKETFAITEIVRRSED